MSENNEKHIPYFILSFYLGLLLIPFLYEPPHYKEITIIVEEARYFENFRITQISFYKGRRASVSGEWTYLPQGNLRENVLIFDRTEPPDPQLNIGGVYLIRHTNTNSWRVAWIKEIN